jgi:hypothetical protein
LQTPEILMLRLGFDIVALWQRLDIRRRFSGTEYAAFSQLLRGCTSRGAYPSPILFNMEKFSSFPFIRKLTAK